MGVRISTYEFWGLHKHSDYSTLHSRPTSSDVTALTPMMVTGQLTYSPLRWVKIAWIMYFL